MREYTGADAAAEQNSVLPSHSNHVYNYVLHRHSHARVLSLKFIQKRRQIFINRKNKIGCKTIWKLSTLQHQHQLIPHKHQQLATLTPCPKERLMSHGCVCYTTSSLPRTHCCIPRRSSRTHSLSSVNAFIPFLCRKKQVAEMHYRVHVHVQARPTRDLLHV